MDKHYHDRYVSIKQRRGINLSTGAMDIGRGIDHTTVFEYFEVNVGAGGTATAAHFTYDLAFLDYVAHLDQQLLVMTVSAREPATMIDFNHLAVAAAWTGVDYHAGSDGDNVRTVFSSEINTIVPGQSAIDRVGSSTIPGRHPSLLYRSSCQEYITLNFSVNQQCLQDG